MTNDPIASDQQQPAGSPGPTYAAPTQSPVPAPGGPVEPPAGYSAPAPVPSQPSPDAPGPYAPGPISPYGGAAVTPQLGAEAAMAGLPRENVAKGTALALLALVLGAIVSGIVWKLGYVASISSLLVGIAAVALYRRGSGGRVRKGIPVLVAIILLGIPLNFFTAVAVDLWSYFPQLDADVAATYAGRGDFVAENLFYGPVLGEYTKDLALFVLFGLLGGAFAFVRVMRARTH